MKINKSRQIVEDALNHAGITIGGDNPWDIRVHNEEFFDRMIRDGELGVGESYMDGWWDSPALDQLFERVFRENVQQYFRDNWKATMHLLKARLRNLQKNERAYTVGKQH
jgi:cyclopropane-fatty-acyl-phospholipid synthase